MIEGGWCGAVVCVDVGCGIVSMDVWMCGCEGVLMCGCVDVQMCGRVDGCDLIVYIRVCGCVVVWMWGCLDGWMCNCVRRCSGCGCVDV